MESLPGYVSSVFILTTFAAIAFLLQAAKHSGLHSLASRILLFTLPLWVFFQAILAIGGFYQITDAMPPRLMVFGVLPAITLIVLYLAAFRRSFVERLPVRLLTLLHVVRVPVELVLYWLFLGGAVPKAMTFAGWNFDILSGLIAPIVYFTAFRGKADRRWLAIAFNLFGLVLLGNIVAIAIMSLPTPMQQIAFDQPNRAVLYFPYVWLPTIVVPIVLFAHLTSLVQLLTSKNDK
ncbi:MAG: hypothetical protein WBO10_08570 [Pyrinomonadaceae bacterium]